MAGPKLFAASRLVLVAAAASCLSPSETALRRADDCTDGVCPREITNLLVDTATRLEVSGQGVAIAHGDRTPALSDGSDFGAVVPSQVASRVFTLHNTGRDTITLTGSPPVTLEHAGGFVVTAQPEMTELAPGASASFTVAFAPGSEGASFARVAIPNSAGTTVVFSIAGDATFFPSFSDHFTTALWLMDERQYGAHTTLIDASPREYDLLTMSDGVLAPGRFGAALRAKPGSGFHVSYAGWQADLVNEKLRGEDGEPSGLYPPTMEPRGLLESLASPDWTLELWLKLDAAPTTNAVLIDLGDAYLPGFDVSLGAGGATFDVRNHYAGVQHLCATSAALSDGSFHHVVFERAGGALRHFVDGVEMTAPTSAALPTVPLPASSTPIDLQDDTRGFTLDKSDDWKRQHRFNVTLAEDRHGAADLDATLDEVRFSSRARYGGDFIPPGSFARAHGASPPAAVTPVGPPLLFPGNETRGRTDLGTSKHLFLDDVLLDSIDDELSLRIDPPGRRQDIVVRTPDGDEPLIPPGSTWRESVYDHDGYVYLFIADGYSSGRGISRLFRSVDGVVFEPVPVDLFEDGGTTSNNFVFHRRPLGAVAFKDPNPNASPEELFKVTAFAPNRGTMLYVSPDGLHYRRNESQMLPLMSGGDAETFFDDQRGLYVTQLKRDSGSRNGDLFYRGRRSVRFATSSPFIPWPMNELEKPYYEGYPIPTVTDEGHNNLNPIVDVPLLEEYEVFRSRAQKYAWADDAYVAFPWLGYKNHANGGDSNDGRRRTRVAVSRDGANWKYYDEDWYIDSDGTVDGEGVRDAISVFGLIRRGDEIWQYGEYCTENNGNGACRFSRVKQRLDGFVSLHVGGKRGKAVTKPFTFSGRFLELNMDVDDRVRIGIRDEKNKRALDGFDTDDCDPLVGDSLARRVSWKGKSDLSALAGRTIRLEFDLEHADIYAFQFVP